MNFPESQLVRALKSHFQDRAYLTTTELSLGYGRADLVAFRIDTDRCKERLNNGQHRSLDRVEHYSLLRILPEVDSGKSVSLRNLAESLNLSPARLRQDLLSFLIRFGYAFEVEHHQYVKLNGFVPIANEIIAVEAKIADWRKGAIQAKRYNVFANGVYLALPKEFAHRVDRSLLERHNIGLLTFHDKQFNEEISAPQIVPKDVDRFNYACEWIWRYRRSDLRELIRHASN